MHEHVTEAEALTGGTASKALAAGYCLLLLSVVCFLLLVVRCSLLVAVVCCWFFVVRCSLFVVVGC